MQSLGILRPVLDSELEIVRAWRNAPSVRANMYTKHEISRTEHEGWWDGVKRDSKKQYFMYVARETPSGVVAFTAIDKVNLHCSWAFYAAPTAPAGTGGCMEYLALEHAFFALGLHKLHCEVLESNTSVIRLHKKFGFAEEGVFRHQYKGQDGYMNIHRLGLLEEEWRAKRADMKQRLLATRRQG
jgi:UDP-4-amino-4,6-dideoxy-N-acetyl-beta-L-altrosamine N-acetyltransferase